MTILGGMPGGMDEAAEPKASLCLEGNQLGLLKIQNPQIGQCIEVCAELCIEAITAYPDEKGNPHLRISFTVESIELDMDQDEGKPMSEMDSIRAMYKPV